MKEWERELHVSRITLGKTLIYVGEEPYLYGTPNSTQVYLANIEYSKVLREAQESEVPSEVEVLEWLLERGIWSPDYDSRMEKISTEIEDTKINLFHSMFRSIESRELRKQLDALRTQYSQLFMRRHQYDYLTDIALASLAKAHYMAGFSLEDLEGKKIYTSAEFLDLADASIISQALEEINRGRLSDGELRELARTEPWRQYWSCSKHLNIFDGAVNLYNDEQRVLILWSRMYDSVMEAAESPHESVIEDDDLLDGWMLIQKREREANQKKKQAEVQVSKNERISKAQNVFVVADTLEDARKLTGAMNDATGNAIRKQRTDTIKQKGRVEHYKLPDMHQDLIIQAQNEFKNKMMGKDTK